jgi:Zn-dependent M16 (insulinase) family peptidase
MTDLASTPKMIPRVVEHFGVGARERPMDVLLHEQPCNGIGYFRLLFDIKHVVPERLLPLVPLYSRCLTHLGTTLCDEVCALLRGRCCCCKLLW